MAINMDVVRARLLRGLYTGLGAVVTGGVGNVLANSIDSEKGVAVAQIATGAALSVGADEVFSNRQSVPNEAMEFAGYGMQAVGWDEMAESLNIGFGGTQTGARVVNVRSNANGGSNQTGQNTSRSSTEDEFSVELG